MQVCPEMHVKLAQLKGFGCFAGMGMNSAELKRNKVLTGESSVPVVKTWNVDWGFRCRDVHDQTLV